MVVVGKQGVVRFESQRGGQHFRDTVNRNQGFGHGRTGRVFDRNDEPTIFGHAVAFDAGKSG